MEEEEIERAAQTFYPPQHTRAEEIEDEEAYLRDFFKEEDEKFIRERDASIARDKICCAAGALIFAAGVIGSGFYRFKSKVFLLLLFFGGAAMGVFFVAMKLACTEKKMRNSAKGHRLIRPFALNVYVAGTYVGPEMQNCNLYLLGFCFRDENDCENEATTDEFRLYEEEDKDLFCGAFQRGELLVALNGEEKAVVLETGRRGGAEEDV